MGHPSGPSDPPRTLPPTNPQLRAPCGGKPGVGGTGVYTCRVHLPSPGLKLSLTPLPRPRVQTLALLPGLCWVCPCRCPGRMKPGCVTLGHLLTLSGYRSFKWGGLLEAPSASGRIRPSSRFTSHQPPLAGFQARPRIFWFFSGLVSCASSGSGAVPPQSPGNCPRRTEPSRGE